MLRAWRSARMESGLPVEVWMGQSYCGDMTPYTSPGEFGVTDVNRDGITNILDLVLVAAHFGKLGGDGADINER